MSKIITVARVRTALGLTTSITDLERILVALAHTKAEAAVKDYLLYDPLQRTTTEYYPMAVSGEAPDPDGPNGYWDRNSSRAYWTQSGGNGTIQLRRLPVRTVASVYVDADGRFGQRSGAFAAATLWTAGDQYWIEYEQDNLGLAGQLIASGTWPGQPGSVKVTYRAGYSPKELLGQALASGTDGDGNITTAGVDASAIAGAVEIAAVKAFHTLHQFLKKQRTGFTPGAYASETLGSYSYSLAQTGAESVTGMKIALPAEAADMLEPYRNLGLLLAG